MHDQWRLFYICARNKTVQKLADKYTSSHGKFDSLEELFHFTIGTFLFVMETEKGIPQDYIWRVWRKTLNV